MGVVSKLHGVLPDSVSMAASNRLDPRTVIVCRGLLAYAWVPSQEDLHRLWRADELQAGPQHKKTLSFEVPGRGVALVCPLSAAPRVRL